MQSLKLLILLSFILPRLLSAQGLEKCFVIKESEKDYRVKVSPIAKSRYRLTLNDLSLDQDFFCIGTTNLKCSGDDDSGSFVIESKKSLIQIKHITFGEPEGKSLAFNWTKSPRSFDFKPCN